MVCAASGVCGGALVTGFMVAGTAYFVYDMGFNGGAARLARAFTAKGSAQDALDACDTIGMGLGMGAGIERANARVQVIDGTSSGYWVAPRAASELNWFSRMMT